MWHGYLVVIGAEEPYLELPLEQLREALQRRLCDGAMLQTLVLQITEDWSLSERQRLIEFWRAFIAPTGSIFLSQMRQGAPLCQANVSSHSCSSGCSICYTAKTVDCCSDLRSFAGAVQPDCWNDVFERELHRMHCRVLSREDLFKLAGVTAYCEPSPGPLPFARYKVLAVAGTFDGLHDGHLLLLHTAVASLDFNADGPLKLLVGVSGQSALDRKPFGVELGFVFATRRRMVERTLCCFLRDRGYSNTCDAGVLACAGFPDVQLTFCEVNVDGTSSVDARADLEALVVSEETFAGGEQFNTRRAAHGLDVVPLVVCPLVRDAEAVAAGRKEKLSSSAHRRSLLVETARTHGLDVLFGCSTRSAMSLQLKELIRSVLLVYVSEDGMPSDCLTDEETRRRVADLWRITTGAAVRQWRRQCDR